MKAWIISFLAGVAVALLAVFSWPGTRAASHVVIDSTRVVAMRDSLAPAWARERDSLRRWADSLRAAPPATVWRVLRQAIHDTDTLEAWDTVQAVREVLVDRSECLHTADSLRGELSLCGERYKATAQAVDRLPSVSSCGTRWDASLAVLADSRSVRPGFVAGRSWGWFRAGAGGFVRPDGSDPGAMLTLGARW